VCLLHSVDSFKVGPCEMFLSSALLSPYREQYDYDMQLLFFNNERQEDSGISGSFGAYSNEILASVFGIQQYTSEFYT
jgi:hypothetical protein